MTEVVPITLLSLLVALISLDRTAVGQVMISQPLVGGALLGALLGRPAEGLAAGALFQILCLTELPVGASVPPDGSLAGLIGTALYLTATPAAGWPDGALLGVALLVFFPLARLGRRLEHLIRRANRYWTALALSLAGEGRYGAAQAASLGGILFFFAKAFVLCWLVLRVGSAAIPRIPFAPHLGAPLDLLTRATPFVGLGFVAARSLHRGTALGATAAFAFGYLLLRSFA